MKFTFLMLPFLIVHSFFIESGFYGIPFSTISGNKLNTDNFKGKKIVVALISVNKSSLDVVKYLDSAQRVRKDLQVIAVPTGEFGGNITNSDIINLQKKLTIIITQPLKVKKSNGAYQHPFFAWLTDVSKNKHFGQDADQEGKVFFISASGTLYSILPNTVPLEVMNSVLNQSFNE